MLRVTTVYNSVIGDLVDPTWNSPAAVKPSTYAVDQMAEAQCEVAEAHDGLCADTYRQPHRRHASCAARGGRVRGRSHRPRVRSLAAIAVSSTAIPGPRRSRIC